MNEFKFLQPLDQMERISRTALGQQLDEILDNVDKNNVGYVITDEGKSDLVLCPAHWFTLDEIPASRTPAIEPPYVTIEMQIDSELYEKAGDVFKRYGLTHEEAVVLFLRETIRQGRIPFDYTEEDLKEAERLCDEVEADGE